MTRRTATTAMVTAMGLFLAACSGSDSPSAGSQVSDTGTAPSVNSVPARPELRQDSAGRRTTGEILSADRANARYTEEVIRRANAAPVTTPPPAARITPDGVQIEQGFPATPPPAGSAPVQTTRRVGPSNQSPLGLKPGAARQPDPEAPPPAPADMGVPVTAPAPVEVNQQPLAAQTGTATVGSAAPAPASGLDAQLDAMLNDAYLRPVRTLEQQAVVTESLTSAAGQAQPEMNSARVATLYFPDGSANLDTAAQGVLREVVRLHQSRGGLLRVVGHASRRAETLDQVKRDVANLGISAARADRVVASLRRLGVAGDALIAEAKSDSQATFDEASPAGEAANRRVEIYLEY